MSFEKLNQIKCVEDVDEIDWVELIHSYPPAPSHLAKKKHGFLSILLNYNCRNEIFFLKKLATTGHYRFNPLVRIKCIYYKTST